MARVMYGMESDGLRKTLFKSFLLNVRTLKLYIILPIDFFLLFILLYVCMYVCMYVYTAPFESATDLQLFCYEEIKRLEDKFRATLMRTLPLVQSNINTPGVVSV